MREYVPAPAASSAPARVPKPAPAAARLRPRGPAPAARHLARAAVTSGLGNRGTIAALARAGVRVTAPGEAAEREASAVAARAGRTAPARKPAAPARGRPAAVPGGLPAAVGGGLTGGQPVAPAIRTQLEGAVGSDLGAMRVHTGPAAADAAAAVGARAFTLGSEVVLGAGESPSDVGLMAHEATHVVQQTGDASRVALMRAPTNKVDDPHQVTAAGYAHLHRKAILDAIEGLLTAVKLPDPHPRLTWLADAQPWTALARELRAHLNADKGIAANSLRELMPGLHLAQLIDTARGLPPQEPAAYHRLDTGAPPPPTDPVTQARAQLERQLTALNLTGDQGPGGWHYLYGPRGPDAWQPAVGSAVASALYPKILDSLQRMGGRFLALLELSDKARKQLADTVVVTSLPLDDVVLAALAMPGQLRAAKGDSSKDNVDGKRAVGGPRALQFSWLGEQDRAVRNWIRVWSPVDPTPDDVADMLIQSRWISPYDLNAELLLRIRTNASPPYFWVPVVPDLLRSGDPRVENVNELGQSGFADEVALAQAGGGAGGSKAEVAKAVELLRIQLPYLQRKLAAWGAAGTQLEGAIAFVQRRSEELATDPAAATRWGALLLAQERAVALVAEPVGTLVGQLDALKTDKLGERDLAGSVMPQIRVLVAYGAALGVSHLPRSLAPALAAAARVHADLPFALTQQSLDSAIGGVAGQQATRAGASKAGMWSTREADKNLQAVPGLAARTAEQRARAARGLPVAPGDLDQLGVDADALALRARLTQLVLIMDDLDKAAEAEKLGEKESPRLQIRHAARGLEQLNDAAAKITTRAALERVSGGLRALGNQILDQKAVPAGMDATANDMTTATEGFSQLISWSQEAIANEKLASLIRSIVLEVGLMLLTGQIIGAGMAALRGLNTARRIAVAADLIGEARAARMIFAAGELVFQAGGATLVGSALHGQGPTGGKFLENLLANSITAVAMRPFEKLLGGGAALEKEVGAWREAALKSGRFVARGAVEVGVNLASGKIATAVVTGQGLSGPAGEEVTAAALGFLAGRVAHRRAVEMQTRIESAMQTYGRWHFAELQHRTDAMLREAAGLGKSPSTAAAARVLELSNQLLLAERDAYKEVAGDTSAVDAELGRMGADQLELPLRLAHLEPVPGTDSYRGTAAEIADALAIAQKSGIAVQATQTGDVWTLRSGGRSLEIHQHAGDPGRPRRAPMEHAEPVGRVTLDPTELVTRQNAADLALKLGVPKLRIDDRLTNAVEIHYRKVRTLVGHDIQVVEVVAGRSARVRDAQLHIATLDRIRSYNGVLGKLRSIREPYFGPNSQHRNPFRKGSRGWEAFEEIKKLDLLIDDRAGWDPRKVDPDTVTKEIQFLEGRRSYYEDIIRTAIETRVIGDTASVGKIAVDDVDLVTREATAAGWRLPKEHPEHYYFSRDPARRNSYKLMVKPTAPARTPVMEVLTSGSDPIRAAARTDAAGEFQLGHVRTELDAALANRQLPKDAREFLERMRADLRAMAAEMAEHDLLWRSSGEGVALASQILGKTLKMPDYRLLMTERLASYRQAIEMAGSQLGLTNLADLGHRSRFVTEDAIAPQFREEWRKEFYGGWQNKVDEKFWARSTQEGLDHWRAENPGKQIPKDFDVYRCSDCGRWFSDSGRVPGYEVRKWTLDHARSVVNHWNTEGRLMTQDERVAWYSDEKNLQPMCAKDNQETERVTDWRVGRGFRGRGDAPPDPDDR